MKLKFSYVDGGVHPIRGPIFHWRKEAIGNGEASRYQLYICDVLGAIAQTPGDCSRLLSCIEKIESEKKEQLEVGGNDVTLTLDTSGVQVDIESIEDWIGHPEGHFTLQEWRVALEGWRRFLELPRSLESIVEIDL